ncbi:MAG: hypothetical protein FJZ04_00065 [Candidatus Moranbacteria bacterium]|nr:hypothetical protein [Candidatus Moranbacteria bacterium]
MVLFKKRVDDYISKIALLIAIALFLLAFWGVFYFIIRFLEVGSYSAPQEVKPQNNQITIDGDGGINQYIQERSQKRQKALTPLFLKEGEKDPFSLP